MANLPPFLALLPRLGSRPLRRASRLFKTRRAEQCDR